MAKYTKGFLPHKESKGGDKGRSDLVYMNPRRPDPEIVPLPQPERRRVPADRRYPNTELIHQNMDDISSDYDRSQMRHRFDSNETMRRPGRGSQGRSTAADRRRSQERRLGK